jgi:beta-lactamase class A
LRYRLTAIAGGNARRHSLPRNRRQMDQTRFDDLTAALEEINAVAPAAAAVFDYQTGRSWSFHGDRWFHAASTIKIAVLACTYTTLQERDLTPSHQLDVRNRFVSAADGRPYQLLAPRDSDPEIYSEIDRTMRIGDLARRMIAVSSNLATNVLLDFVGVARARLILADAGGTGIDLVRGVEDDRAFEAGISNRVTAEGLVGLLRAILDGRFGSEASKEEMLGILCAQTFNSGIPAGLPSAIRGVARIAHKTGEISTATHDAGIVFLPGRQPYALAILTGMGPDAPDRYERIASISRRAFDCIASAAARLENRR